MNIFQFGSSIIALIFILAFSSSPNHHMNSMPENMDNLDQLWNSVDSLKRNGFPKKALELLQGNESLVMSQGMVDDKVLYQTTVLTLRFSLEELSYNDIYQALLKNIEGAEGPEKSLYHVVTGHSINNYLSQNSWRIQERTSTNTTASADIETWTVDELQTQAAFHMLQAIEDTDNQSIIAVDYKRIVLPGKGLGLTLVPTLYDLIAEEVMNFFSNDLNFITKPVYAFALNDSSYFEPSTAFQQLSITTPDTLSSKWQMLLLYQNLLKAHPTGLSQGYVDFNRLEYVYKNYTGGNKDNLFLQALKNLAAAHPGEAVEALAWTGIGEYHLQHSYQYDRLDPDALYKDSRSIARAYFKKAIEQYPSHPFCERAYSNLASVEQPLIQVVAENYYPSSSHKLLGLRYKSLSQVNTLVFQLDKEVVKAYAKQHGQINVYGDEVTQLWENSALISESTVTLGEIDYNEHWTEVSAGKLGLGYYVVVATDKKQKDLSSFFTHAEKDNKTLSAVLFQVTDLAPISNEDRPEASIDYLILDRTSGRPVHNVTCNVWERVNRKHLKHYSKSVSKDGTFRLTHKGKEHGRYLVIYEKGSDEYGYLEGTNWISKAYSNQPRTYDQSILFTDRAIYRPGQTLYFKGIAFQRTDREMPEVLANHKVSVQLLDVHHKKVGKLDLVTNEFGSVQGHFVIPKSGVTGNYRLSMSPAGSKIISVEEYKRPKYEVTINPPEGDYAINDDVEISGKAMAFAGYGIDGAMVNYRIERQASYPYWRWSYFANQSSQMIESGQLTTESDGSFKIRFKAIPDLDVSPEVDAIFNYTITADVTDINGEAHSVTARIKVGNVSFVHELDIPQKIHVDSLRNITYYAQNLNGQPTQTTGEIIIQALETPKQVYINRYWSRPDEFVMSARDYQDHHKYYAYKNADLPESWATVSSTTHTVTADKDGRATYATTLKPGTYRIIATAKNAQGESHKVFRIVHVFSTNKRAATHELFWSEAVHSDELQPGDQAQVALNSAEDINYYTLQATKKGPALEKFTVRNQVETVKWPITTADYGGFQQVVFAVRHNRFYTKNYYFNVPLHHKELDIQWSTIRHTIEPGSPEKWSLNISGHHKDKVAAEVLLTMYDASLDQFRPNYFENIPYVAGRRLTNYYGGDFSTASFAIQHAANLVYPKVEGLNFNRFKDAFILQIPQLYPSVVYSNEEFKEVSSGVALEVSDRRYAKAKTAAFDSENVPAPPTIEEVPDESEIKESVNPRSNLNETVFFYPSLRTDMDGNIRIEFTMNEALTTWRLLTYAHTEDLSQGQDIQEIITQKDFMMIPNPPRFLRESDIIEFSAKVVNLTDQPLAGNAELQLLNELTNVPVYKWLDNPIFNKNFTVEGASSTSVSWRFKVPDVTDASLIQWTATAAAGSFTDGELGLLPVITNRTLVTESMPLPIRKNESKTFELDRLTEVLHSPTATVHATTIEFTSNPTWYAVQALPYLMEYPHECSEQVFNQFFANALAENITAKHPKIKKVFEQWKALDSEALLSNLRKNEELKSVVLEETPWVLAAESEEAQKQNIALLFDVNHMAMAKESALKKLASRQHADGGFPWFAGARYSDWYISQYIAEGIGRLVQLDIQVGLDQQKGMIQSLINYIDQKALEHYKRIEKNVSLGHTSWDKNNLSSIMIHYLYTRSLMSDYALNKEGQKVYNYFLGQAETYWLKFANYEQAMAALALYKKNQEPAARLIMSSLKDRSTTNEELGMYWRSSKYGYHWNQLPIETHALMIEAFDRILEDEESVYQLKVWLLQNKKTNAWPTTKATAAAVYALLVEGDDWLSSTEKVSIQIDQKELAPTSYEPGTGYFKQTWSKEDIIDPPKSISLKNPNNHVAWGAYYWQYFEDLDRVTTFEDTPLRLKKEIYRKVDSDRGAQLELVSSGTIHPGDRLTIRIELRVDRDMQYLHMKDFRAAGIEPVNVLSSYKWQDGLGYYESTKDIATHFFISSIRPGTYVFEYPVVAQLEGEYSNGYTTIQCMYAPEYTSHSAGQRVVIKAE